MKNPFTKTLKARIEDLQDRLGNLPQEKLNIYYHTMAMRKFVDDRSSEIFAHMLIEDFGGLAYEPERNMGNCQSKAILRARSQPAVEFTVVKGMLALAEASPEFKSAAAIIEPMLKELAELKDGDRNEQAEFHRGSGELRQMQEEAQRQALEAFNNSPAYLKKKQQLEASLLKRGE